MKLVLFVCVSNGKASSIISLKNEDQDEIIRIKVKNIRKKICDFEML